MEDGRNAFQQRKWLVIPLKILNGLFKPQQNNTSSSIVEMNENVGCDKDSVYISKEKLN